MGGDEFAIIQAVVEQPADAAHLAARVTESVARPYDIDGNHCVIGVSIGMVIGPRDGAQSETLMRNADLALYGVKGSKRGSFQFFDPAMDVQTLARRSKENDLPKAPVAAGSTIGKSPTAGDVEPLLAEHARRKAEEAEAA
jgi:predicted signal transduction protein with EAL and GGDEF domain